jgi:hypothetical protein
LVSGYGDPTAFAGPHKVEILLRSGHFFLLYSRLMQLRADGEGIAEPRLCNESTPVREEQQWRKGVEIPHK